MKGLLVYAAVQSWIIVGNIRHTYNNFAMFWLAGLEATRTKHHSLPES
jgi:hypothetical protein